jgi:murein tripeptide amidase MpaA
MAFPFLGYLTSSEIEIGLAWINAFFPGFTERIPLHELSADQRQRRTIHALRIRSGEDERNGVLLIGGTHAHELINPDLLLHFAINLCRAYANDSGLTFGAKTWSASEIQLLKGGMDIFIVPNINPDGRSYVQSDWESNWRWRKNRGTNSDGTRGADLNRNFDFLWDCAIGSSTDGKDQSYRGDEAFSEPESRNVRWLLREYPHITCVADVHSYGEDILHPWGDADNQSTDPSESFENPAWDGLREGGGYREYIPAADETKLIERGEKMHDAIAAVRGRNYKVGQSLELIGYATAGTVKDYAYSRFFVGPATKVWAYTIETNHYGTSDDMDSNTKYGLAPPYGDALQVMSDVQSGLIQFMLSCLCIVREIGRKPLGPDVLDELAHFRDEEMLKSRRGRRWGDTLDTHGDELLSLLIADAHARRVAEQILVDAADIVLGRDRPHPPVIDPKLSAGIERLATLLEKHASRELRKDLTTIRKDAESVTGKTAREAIG